MKKYKKHDHDAIFEMVRTYYLENKIPPSISEIGVAFGIKSKSHVHYILNKLTKSGQLKKIGGKSTHRRYVPVLEVSNETAV